MARDPTWITGVARLIGVPPVVGWGRTPPGGWDACGRRDAVPLQWCCSLAIQCNHHEPRALLRRSIVTWWMSHHPSGPPRRASSDAWPLVDAGPVLAGCCVARTCCTACWIRACSRRGVWGAAVGQRSALRPRPHAPRVRSARHAVWASRTSTGYVVVCIPVLRAGWTPSAPTAGWRFWM